MGLKGAEPELQGQRHGKKNVVPLKNSSCVCKGMCPNKKYGPCANQIRM